MECLKHQSVQIAQNASIKGIKPVTNSEMSKFVEK